MLKYKYLSKKAKRPPVDNYAKIVHIVRFFIFFMRLPWEIKIYCETEINYMRKLFNFTSRQLLYLHFVLVDEADEDSNCFFCVAEKIANVNLCNFIVFDKMLA